MSGSIFYINKISINYISAINILCLIFYPKYRQISLLIKKPFNTKGHIFAEVWSDLKFTRG